ncbi:MAG: toll/interleukin-1 receptor domain-containing protein [Gammaproteobacteria bacterium]|nr:toll/interleukin-1 receptor domain-containing protein [Gammaproteobacteria bacterium]
MLDKQQKFAVFISHASKDIDKALELVELLESKGLNCWIAPRNIRPSKSYSHEISYGISTSKCLILLLSDEANQSGAVRNEIELAFRKSKPIFPVRIEEVPPGAELEFFVSSVQWVDAWKGQLPDYIEIIAESIEHGEIAQLAGRTRRRIRKKNMLLAIGGIVFLGILSAVYYAATSLRKNVATTVQNQQDGDKVVISNKDLNKNLFRPVPAASVYPGQFGVKIKISPVLSVAGGHTFWNTGTKLYCSINGKEYVKGMSFALCQINPSIATREEREGKKIFIKFELWGGEIIGPFEYEMRYKKYQEDN